MTPSVFLALGILGLLLLVVSAFLDGDGDVDFGADFESDVELEVDAGGSILDWFSIKAIAAGLVGFGFIGFALQSLGVFGSLLWIFSLLSGLVLWSIVALVLVPWLRSQQGHDMKSINSLVGLTARVVVRIQADGIGTVQVTDRSGMITRVNASTLKGKEIPANIEVLIISADSDGVIVDTYQI